MTRTIRIEEQVELTFRPGRETTDAQLPRTIFPPFRAYLSQLRWGVPYRAGTRGLRLYTEAQFQPWLARRAAAAERPGFGPTLLLFRPLELTPDGTVRLCRPLAELLGVRSSARLCWLEDGSALLTGDRLCQSCSDRLPVISWRHIRPSHTSGLKKGRSKYELFFRKPPPGGRR